MATSRDSAAPTKKASPHPILGLGTPPSQNFWLDSAAALVAGRCGTTELDQIARLNRQQTLLSDQLVEHDARSSDDEGTADLSLSANAYAAEATRGTVSEMNLPARERRFMNSGGTTGHS